MVDLLLLDYEIRHREHASGEPLIAQWGDQWTEIRGAFRSLGSQRQQSGVKQDAGLGIASAPPCEEAECQCDAADEREVAPLPPVQKRHQQQAKKDEELPFRPGAGGEQSVRRRRMNRLRVRASA